jgi:2-oxoglutarate ferredoxin oxidoreductase subunit beta
MEKTFTKTKMITETMQHYCPGCTHGVIHRLIGEVIEELGVMDQTIAVASVGCSVLSYNYFNCDGIESAHGRAPAVATGVKRTLPDKVVFTYQGDGDLASIGMAETVHVAARNENITTIFVNNAIYGMTGGQMAPTTLEGQVTTTSPYGKTSMNESGPIKVCEMLSTLDGPAHIERVSVHDVRHLIKAKKAIKKAFECQLAGKGFSLVEVLSTCPSGWGISPVDALKWVKDNMIPAFPLGVYKSQEEEG